jgi:Na+/proline symporter
VGGPGIGLGYPGMPHVVTRYMATRSRKEIRRLRVIAMLWGVSVFYGAGLLGLACRGLYSDLPDREWALMVVALDLFHPVLAGLMLAAVASAILSTVSSQLLVAASAVSYDVVERMMGRAADDRRSLVLGRVTVIIIGLLGVGLALTEARMVFWFVLFAWSGLGASFGPLVLLSFTRWKVSRHGALAGMLTGSGVTIAWNLGRDVAANQAVFELVPVVTPLVAGLFVLIALLLRRSSPGQAVAVAAAAVVTISSWWLVQQWGLHGLYELVPAFFLAAATTLVVSRIMPGDEVGVPAES